MKKASPALIGAFVVGGTLLIIGALILLGSGRFFANVHAFILYFPGQVDGLRVGAPVRFKGVDIGAVSKIMLQYDQKPEDRHIPVFIELDMTKVLSAGGVNDFSSESIKEAIDRGLRGQLQTESLLTGLLFVQLDFQPDTPATFVGIKHELPEIPTLPTALEQVQIVVRRMLAKLEHLDFDRLVNSFEHTVDSIDRLVSSPEIKETIVSLRQTLESIERLSDQLSGDLQPAIRSFVTTANRSQVTMGELDLTLKTARGVVAPDSPLAYQISRTLEEISLAARGLRALSESLERDPSAILRGRTGQGRQE
jgi:paraquat-inducible protein B